MKNQPPARTIKKIGIIIPTSSTSKTDQKNIDHHITKMIADAAKAYQKQGIELELHVTGSRTGNHTIRNRVKAFNNVTARTHTPNFSEATGRRGLANEIHRTNGRLAATVDGLLVITGYKESLTSMDREIMNAVQKRDKPIKIRKMHPVRTPEDMIPDDARPILPQSAYRVNLKKYKNLDALLQDHCSHGLDDGQKPIYCGAPNKKTNDQGSPLANQDRYKPNSLKLYKTWLWTEMQKRTPAIMAELRKIDRTTPLICYCHPRKKCHTDIIRDAAVWLTRQDHADETAAYKENV